MKEIIICTVVLLSTAVQVFACDLCKSHQPEVLQEVTHGMGPQGTMDYILLWGAVIIVLITLILSIALLAFPKRMDKNNRIKFLPVNDLE